LGYLGSKEASGVFQAIISQMPPHDVYIESHLGGGAVMRRKTPATHRSIGIDADQQVLDSFQCPYPVELVCTDAQSFIDGFSYELGLRVLLYVDPPYLHCTRTSRSRYRHEYTTQDHIRLIESLRTVPAFVILSGYPSPLYDSLLPEWRTIELQAMTRGGPRTEKLWMNYDLDAVHWHTYAGRNFTDRQRIKRKAIRWAAKFKALPPGERAAILQALLNTSTSAHETEKIVR